jgi:hypothetical protein
MKRGVPAKIFVPAISSPAKIARIRSYGADLVVGGERYADAQAASVAWAEQTGALQVHAFDQEETLLGQGTLARELEAQAPDLDTRAGRRRRRRTDRRRRGVVRRPRARGRRRAGGGPHPPPARSPPASRSTRPAAASPRTPLAPRRVGALDVPDRAAPHRVGGAGQRRRNPRGAASAVGGRAHRRRARRRGRDSSAALRALRAARGRARRRGGQRRQHDRGGFRDE